MANPYNRTVRLKWADGEHDFRLGLKEIFELEAVCECGLGGIARRLASHEWRYRHVRDTIRLGLIGGGMPAARALQMAEMYLDEGSILAALPVAIRVIDVTLDPPAGLKKKDQPKTRRATRTKPSTQPTYTAAAS